MANWVKVCESKSLKNGDMIEFDHEDKRLLITKSHNKIYALDRICTHAYADLTTGFMNEDEKTVTCPLHMSRFNLESGSPENLPADVPLTRYDVNQKDGWIQVLLQ